MKTGRCPVLSFALEIPISIPWKGSEPWFMVVDQGNRSETAIALNKVPKLIDLIVQPNTSEKFAERPQKHVNIKNNNERDQPTLQRFVEDEEGANKDYDDVVPVDNDVVKSKSEMLLDKMIQEIKNLGGKKGGCKEEQVKGDRSENERELGGPKDFAGQCEGTTEMTSNSNVRSDTPLLFWVAYTECLYHMEYFENKLSVRKLISNIQAPIRSIIYNEDRDDVVVSCRNGLKTINASDYKEGSIPGIHSDVLKLSFLKKRHLIVMVGGANVILLLNSYDYKIKAKVRLTGSAITHADISDDKNGNIFVGMIDRDKGIRIVLVNLRFEIFDYKLSINLKSRELLNSISVLSAADCILVGTNMMNFIHVQLPECYIVEYLNLSSFVDGEIKQNRESHPMGPTSNSNNSDIGTTQSYGCHKTINALQNTNISCVYDSHDMCSTGFPGVRRFADPDYLQPSNDRNYVWLNADVFGEGPVCILFKEEKAFIVEKLYSDVDKVVYDGGNLVISTDMAGRLMFGVDKTKCNFGRSLKEEPLGFPSLLLRMRESIREARECLDRLVLSLSTRTKGMLESPPVDDGLICELSVFLLALNIHQSTLDMLLLPSYNQADNTALRENLVLLFMYYKSTDVCESSPSCKSKRSGTFDISKMCEDDTDVISLNKTRELLLNDTGILYTTLFRESPSSCYLTRRKSMFESGVGCSSSQMGFERNDFALLGTNNIKELHEATIRCKVQNKDLLKRIHSHYEAFISYEKLVEQLKGKLVDMSKVASRCVPVFDIDCAALEKNNENAKRVRFTGVEEGCGDATQDDTILCDLIDKIKAKYTVGDTAGESPIMALKKLVEDLLDDKLPLKDTNSE